MIRIEHLKKEYANATPLKDVSVEIHDGDVIAVPNDTTNEARALLLLQTLGIIKLKDGAGLTATKQDIVENPKNQSITPTTPSTRLATALVYPGSLLLLPMTISSFFQSMKNSVS